MRKFHTLQEEKEGKELAIDFINSLKRRYPSPAAYFWAVFPTYVVVFENPHAAQNYDPKLPCTSKTFQAWKDFYRLLRLYPGYKKETFCYEHCKMCIHYAESLQKDWDEKTGR